MKKALLLVSLLILSAVFIFNACSSGGSSGGITPSVSTRYIDFATENPVVPANWEAGETEEDGTKVFFIDPDISYAVKAAVFAGDVNNTDVSGEYEASDFIWSALSAVKTAILSRDGKSIEMKAGIGGYGTINLTVTDVGIFTFKVKDKALKP